MMVAEQAGSRRRGEIGAVVGVLLAGGAVALVVAQAGWVHVHSGGVSGTVAVLVGVPLDLVVPGTDAAPAVVPLAVLALAGAVGMLATRGWFRRVLAGLLVLAGAGLVMAGAHVLADPRGSTAAALAHQSVDAVGRSEAAYATTWWWPVLAMLGGVLVAAAGLTALLRSGGWPAMGARYEAPSRAVSPGGAQGRAPTGERTVADVWSALDRGEDPTLADEQTGAAAPGGDLPQ